MRKQRNKIRRQPNSRDQPPGKRRKMSRTAYIETRQEHGKPASSNGGGKKRDTEETDGRNPAKKMRQEEETESRWTNINWEKIRELTEHLQRE